MHLPPHMSLCVVLVAAVVEVVVIELVDVDVVLAVLVLVLVLVNMAAAYLQQCVELQPAMPEHIEIDNGFMRYMPLSQSDWLYCMDAHEPDAVVDVVDVVDVLMVELLLVLVLVLVTVEVLVCVLVLLLVLLLVLVIVLVEELVDVDDDVTVVIELHSVYAVGQSSPNPLTQTTLFLSIHGPVPSLHLPPHISSCVGVVTVAGAVETEVDGPDVVRELVLVLIDVVVVYSQHCEESQPPEPIHLKIGRG